MKNLRKVGMQIIESIEGSNVEHVYNYKGNYIHTRTYDIFKEDGYTFKYKVKDLTDYEVSMV